MEQPKLAEELRQMQYEPLLPIEKRLIAGSVVLGLLLIAVLVWVRHLLFQ